MGDSPSFKCVLLFSFKDFENIRGCVNYRQAQVINKQKLMVFRTDYDVTKKTESHIDRMKKPVRNT